MTIRKYLLILALISAFGCGQKKKAAQYDNSFVGQVHELESRQDNFYACDYKQHTLKLEIAQALEKHDAEIKRYYKSPYTYQYSPGQYHELDTFGPTKIWKTYKFIQQPDQWAFELQSWEDLYDQMKAIGTSQIKWAELSKNFQYILSNDRWRILDGANLLLDVGSELDLRSMIQKLDQCIIDQQCDPHTFTESEQRILTEFNIYARYFDKLSDATYDAAIVKNLRAEISADLWRYSFTKYNRAYRKENILHIPVYTKDFLMAKNAIDEIVDRFWNNFDLKIKIDWIDDIFDSVYKIVFLQIPGGRLNISHFELRLFPNPMDSSIAHELGHILGFNDTYFVIWNPIKCEYIQKTNLSDIMSSSEFGAVLDKHITTLKTQYPISN